MGETLRPVAAGFNRSLTIETQAERLTGDPGAVLLREVLDATGIVPWMAARMRDGRRQADVVHDLPSLLRTMMLLAAQGWRDHDDSDGRRRCAIGPSDNGDAARSGDVPGGQFLGRAGATDAKRLAGLATDIVTLRGNVGQTHKSQDPA